MTLQPPVTARVNEKVISSDDSSSNEFGLGEIFSCCLSENSIFSFNSTLTDFQYLLLTNAMAVRGLL